MGKEEIVKITDSTNTGEALKYICAYEGLINSTTRRALAAELCVESPRQDEIIVCVVGASLKTRRQAMTLLKPSGSKEHTSNCSCLQKACHIVQLPLNHSPVCHLLHLELFAPKLRFYPPCHSSDTLFSPTKQAADRQANHVGGTAS